MSHPAIDLIGQRFGMLTVIERVENAGRSVRYKCRCICGNESTVNSGNLRNGHTRSCGCATKKMIGAANSTHGLSKTKVHRAWAAMRNRCFNPKNKRYPYYGGRGITVCDRWSSFDNFLFDMGYPDDHQSIDRINNNGNYEPSNCRWVDHKTQCRNRRTNVVLEYNGEKILLCDLANKIHVDQTTLHRRIKKLGVDTAVNIRDSA